MLVNLLAIGVPLLLVSYAFWLVHRANRAKRTAIERSMPEGI